MSYLSFDIGVAMLTTYDEDGFPVVQVDAFGEENSGVVPYEQHSQFGIISRPHDPADGRGCQVLYAMEAGRGHAWVLSDPRVIPLLPPIDKGGSCIYGGNIKAPTFFNIDGVTNSVMLYVPYDLDDDGVPQKAMSFSISVDNKGEEVITIAHGEGTAIILNKDSAILKNAAGDAYIEVGASGIILNGAVTIQGGASIGGTTTVPLASGPAVSDILGKLIAIVALIVGTSGTGAPASALAGLLATIPLKNTKGS